MSAAAQHPLLLGGLDGSNLLAFLASLGTLRSFARAWPQWHVALSWILTEGAWKPQLWLDEVLPENVVIDALDAQLQTMRDHRALSALGDDLNVKPDWFRLFAVSAAAAAVDDAQPASRVLADFAAAFGSEVCTRTEASGLVIQDTAFRTMSGAGGQHFLQFMRDIVDQTRAGHLARALFLPWDYCDKGPGLNLRWDPSDDRRYALRWANPAKDPITTMRGANRLAIEGLPLVPTMPTANGLETTCCTPKGRRGAFVRWPIWSYPIGLDVVRSLLSHPAVVDPTAARTRLAMGIEVVYTSERVLVGKYRNFTPARASG